jgi:putative N6-adenine-specific DNA methylase
VNKTFEIVAKTFYGLEDILADELGELGAPEIRKLNRAVSFRGDKELLYRANYCLRTAVKILVPLYETTVKNDSDLYNAVKRIQWEDHIGLTSTFAIEAVINSPAFTHSLYVEQKIKDAVADRFRDKYGKRPNVDVSDPDIKIHANISGDRLKLSLDSSGLPLFKRGYRAGQGEAPVNEVLAAALVKLSGWKGDNPLMDFMCGSGTIVIEAALIALGIPPGAAGRKYAFQNWKDYDEQSFQAARSATMIKQKKDVRIFASDISPLAVNLARKNALNAKVHDSIVFSRCRLDDVKPFGESGTVIINPPYGERLKQENLNELYNSIGNKLKKDFTGSEAWIFSGSMEALKHIGLHPSKKMTLFNGQLECKFQKYSLYTGSKKNQNGN